MKKLAYIAIVTTLILTMTACSKEEVTSVTSTVSSIVDNVNEKTTSIADKVDEVKQEVEKTDLSGYEQVDIPEVEDNIPEVEFEGVHTKENRPEVPSNHPVSGIALENLYDHFREIDGDLWEKYWSPDSYEIHQLNENESTRYLTIGEYYGVGAYQYIENAWSDDITMEQYCDAQEKWKAASKAARVEYSNNNPNATMKELYNVRMKYEEEHPMSEFAD